MKCLVCGKDLPIEAKFCDSCGTRVINDSLGDNGVDINKSLNNESIGFNNELVEDNTLKDNMFTKVDVVSGIGSNEDETKKNIDSVLENNSSIDSSLNIGNNEANINFDSNQSLTNDFNNKVNSENIASSNDNVDTIDSSMIKKKKKTPIILIIVLFFIAILTGLLVYYFLFMKDSPKDVFTTGMRNVTSKLLAGENNNYTSLKTTFDIKSNINTTDDSLNQIFNITNNVGLKGSISTDYTNKIINGNINISYGNNSLTNVVVYGENSNLYLKLQGLYDKYISMPVTGYDDMFNNNTEDLKSIKKGIDNAFESALKDKYLSSKKQTIDINGVKREVKTSVLTLDSKNSVEFSNDFKAYLVNDSNFIKAISKLTSTDESFIKSTLSMEVTELFDEDEKFVVSVYTSGTKFVGVAFEAVESDGKKSVISLYKIDDNNYQILVKDEEASYSCNLNIKKDNNNKIYTISSKEGGNSIQISLGLNSTYNDKVNKLDVSNSVNYTALTDADTTVIQNNLMQNKAFMAIVNDIYKLSGNLDM